MLQLVKVYSEIFTCVYAGFVIAVVGALTLHFVVKAKALVC
jgi:hypothetical protein